MVDPEKFAQALFKGSVEEVKKLTQECFDRGEKAQDILNRGLVKAMEQVGVKFKNCEIYIPEVLIAARAMHAGLGMLKPILAKSTASLPVPRARLRRAGPRGSQPDFLSEIRQRRLSPRPRTKTPI